MFNYRVKYLTPEETYLEVRRFCRDKHSVEELLQHCHETFGKMLVHNEATYFYKPHNLSALWETIAYEYANHAKDIWFPNRKLVQGPKYVSSMKDSGENDSSSFYNLDNHIIKKIPLFFGIEYTGEYENLQSGGKTIYNPKDIMRQHRKLYDILFDYCYPEGRPEAYGKDNNNNLGNLAKPSIFRFDVKVNGNYRAAFEHIRNELIYRFPKKEGYNKLFAVMELIKHTSQIRSITFSLIKSLVTEEYYGCFHFPPPDSSTEGQNAYRGKVYEHIISRCEDRLKPTEVSESGKKGKTVYFINREIREADAIMYYAYTFFMNLPTKDYFAEMKALFDNQEDIAGVKLSDAFRTERDRLIEKIYNIEQCLSFDTNKVVDKYSNDIYFLICIDENMTSDQERAYCKRHIEHMITLVELCKKLIFRKKEIEMPLIIILDVFYLYIRLKRSKTLIKTTSVGYNKKQVSRPVQIDTAMKNIREEWDNPDDKSVSYHLYMKNIMVETWLTGVLYMIINNMDVHLFKQMLMASEKLFLALTQLLPSISIKRKRSAIEDEDELQTPDAFLNNDYIYNLVTDSLWNLVVDEPPDEDDLLVDKILNELLWD